MRRGDFYFDLPKELIAQRPTARRSASRLLVLDGATGLHVDRQFRELPALLEPGDLLVFNDTRVVPARVHGAKSSGGRVEILLERVSSPEVALVQVRASKTLKTGAEVALPGGVTARMLGREGDLFRLHFGEDVLAYFEARGQMPLPPYIDRAPDADDRERYQTVFARERGAVAAPTAGLHFDADLFTDLAARGIRHTFITLHVGAGTFQPLRVDDLEEHVMHQEMLDVPQSACDAINATRAAGGRVVAVGTTVVRSLETAAAPPGGAPCAARAGTPAVEREPLRPFRGATRLFIKPGYSFRAVDALVTNFHLPESTLLMLCAAFAGRQALLSAYAHAVAAAYRFFSYGDAMFLTPSAGAPAR